MWLWKYSLFPFLLASVIECKPPQHNIEVNIQRKQPYNTYSSRLHWHRVCPLDCGEFSWSSFSFKLKLKQNLNQSLLIGLLGNVWEVATGRKRERDRRRLGWWIGVHVQPVSCKHPPSSIRNQLSSPAPHGIMRNINFVNMTIIWVGNIASISDKMVYTSLAQKHVHSQS